MCKTYNVVSLSKNLVEFAAYCGEKSPIIFSEDMCIGKDTVFTVKQIPWTICCLLLYAG